MVRRRKLELDNLSFIPVNKVPDRVVYTPWPELFEKIPAGQALVLGEYQANPDSIRAALKRFQEKKQFMNLEVRVRGQRGKRTTYILNTTKVERNPNPSQK